MVLAVTESLLGYHSENTGALTGHQEQMSGHCQSGSLTGAVAS